MNRKGFAPLIIVLVVAAIIVVGTSIWYFTAHKNSASVGGSVGIACTQDAKECPDGSYVGRTGPDCEFAACPTITATSSAATSTPISNWQTYTDPQNLFTVIIPLSWNLQIQTTPHPDSYTSEFISFTLPGATSILCTITVYTTEQWQQLMADGEGVPITLLGSSTDYYFAWGSPQTAYDIDGLTADQTVVGAAEIKSSFKIK